MTQARRLPFQPLDVYVVLVLFGLVVAAIACAAFPYVSNPPSTPNSSNQSQAEAPARTNKPIPEPTLFSLFI